MTDQKLLGKVAVVTGASSGIGQVIAESLGMAGAHVFMSGRRTEPMEASRQKIEAAGGGVTLQAFDMRDENAVQAFVESAAHQKGRLDIMVNNAGLGNYTPIADADPQYWREMLEVNVLGLLVGCQAAIRGMRATGSQGHIINISSIAGHMRETGVYGATKAAVNTINASLRQQLEDDTIRVTAIMPGVFSSNFARSFPPEFLQAFAEGAGMGMLEMDADGKMDKATLEELQAKFEPMMGDPQHIADLVHYIVSLPQSIQIEEVIIRPPKAMPIG